MKTSKCLMGVLLSSVLLIGSVFATNTLNINGISVKDGFNMKVKKLIVEPAIRDACDDAGEILKIMVEVMNQTASWAISIV